MKKYLLKDLHFTLRFKHFDMMAKYKKFIFVLRSPYKLGYENSEGEKKKKKIQR